MAATSIRYGFSQSFEVPPQDAFVWSVDFQPDDIALMGEKGKRKVEWISEDAVIITDTKGTGKDKVTKARLVRINPERLSWTNTHISGPNKHSQFWYEIVPDGKGGSRLDFTGLHINYGKKGTKADATRLAREYAKTDGAAWVLLAAAMEKDHRHQT